jgi:thymidylate synthase (FAD)
MKIIEQKYEILSLPEGLLEMLETAGRTCYKSEDKIGCSIPEDQQYPSNCPKYMQMTICSPECELHSSHKFVETLIKRGHHAMIEFGDIIVRFITNRGVTHELVRHRMCSFAQESTRYVKYDGEMEFILPVWLKEYFPNEVFISNEEGKKLFSLQNGNFMCGNLLITDSTVWTWLAAIKNSEEQYQNLLSQNWRPEQAREVLPNSLKTEIVVKANIREWRHMLTLRCAKTVHPQMRALMLPLLKELQSKLPIVFDNL